MLNEDLQSSFSAAICDAIQGLVVLLDPQGHILRWNHRCEETSGYTFAEVRTAPFWETLVAPDECEEARARFDQVRASGAAAAREECWIAKDGARRIIAWADRAVDGRVIRNGVEVTPLRERERRLAWAVEGSKDGFWEWDLATGAIEFTPRAAAILGYEPDDIEPVVDSFFERLHPEDEAEARSAIGAHIAGLTPYYEGDCRLRTKSGGWKWVTFTGRTVARGRDGRPLRLAGSVADIGRRKDLEERLCQESETNRVMADLSTALASAFPLDEFSGLVVEAGKKLTASEEGYAGLRDAAGNLEAAKRFEALAGRHWKCGSAEAIDLPQGSFVAAPACVAGRPAGLVAFARRDPYTAREIEAVAKLANLYAFAIERARSDAALRRANDNLKALFDAAPLAIVAMDPDNRVLMWNPTAEKMFGWKAEEVVGKDFPLAAVTDTVRDAALAGAEISNVQAVRTRKDGTPIPVSLSAARMLDAAGGVTGFMIAYADETERREAEKALRASEERYRALFDENPHPLLVCDLETGRFLAVNGAALRQYGYTRDEFERLNAAALHLPEEAKKLAAARAEIEAGKEARWEAAHCTKDGAVLEVECVCHPFEYGGRRAALKLAHDITARKRAEQGQRESEGRYEDLVAGLALGVYRSTPDGRILMANPALLRMMGYSTFEELSRRNLETEPFETDAPRSRFRDAVETQGTACYEACWRRPDGSTVLVREYAKAVRDAGGRVLFYEGVAEDITERRRARQLLRENEERFRELFEDAPVAYHEIDRDGIVRAVNRAECSLLGRPKEAILNRPVWELLAPGQRELSRAAIARKFSAVEKLRPVQREYLHGNGSTRFCEIHESYFRDAAGAVTGIRSAMVDITERKRVEQALRWSEARLRGMFEGAAIGIVTADLEGRLTAVNPAFERMTGYSQSELRGRHVGVLAVPEDRDRDAQANAEFFSGKRQRLQFEKRYQPKNGGFFWVRLTASLVRDAAGRPEFAIGMVEDITASKRAEEALHRTIEELARSNAELEHFAFVASHDLQEPLRMVTSFMQLLKRRYAGRLDGEADEFIGYAVEGALRMRALIDDLLAYSRVESRAKPSARTETRYAAEQAAANLAAAIEESRAVLTIDDSLPAVNADAGQLVQLFQNLIGNAVKFRAGARPEIRVSAERLNSAWRFSVRDNGIGIEERHRERIFEIFARLHTRAEYPGSGVGLAVAKKIVVRHGGTIGVESEPGNGSTFWFTLPDSRESTICTS